MNLQTPLDRIKCERLYLGAVNERYLIGMLM